MAKKQVSSDIKLNALTETKSAIVNLKEGQTETSKAITKAVPIKAVGDTNKDISKLSKGITETSAAISKPIPKSDEDIKDSK
jgi:hypothetical protein